MRRDQSVTKLLGLFALTLASTALGQERRLTAYVVNAVEEGTVTVVDLPTHRVIDAIRVGRLPQAVVVSPDGHTAYVSNRGSAEISVIRTDVNRVTESIRLPELEPGAPFLPGELALSPDGSQLIAVLDYPDGCPFDAVFGVIDTATKTVSFAGSFGDAHVEDLIFSANGSLYGSIAGGCVDYEYYAGFGLFVPVPGLSRQAVELVTGPQPIEVGGIAVAGGKAYVAMTATNEVVGIDLSRLSTFETRTTRIAVPAPTGMASSRDGKTLYVATRCTTAGDCDGPGTLTFIDEASSSVLATLAVGRAPSRLALVPESDLIVVTNTRDDTVSVVAAPPRIFNATIAAGPAPRDLVVFDRPLRSEPPACLDCNSDSVVTVDEIVSLVSIALGESQTAVCPILAADAEIDITNILAAVHQATAGCTP